jgi:hypothetical protein
MKNFIVVLEDTYSAKVLKQGTLIECQEFIADNQERYGDEAFIQELDDVYCGE